LGPNSSLRRRKLEGLHGTYISPFGVEAEFHACEKQQPWLRFVYFIGYILRQWKERKNIDKNIDSIPRI
jgi:hypothetical protein